MSLEAFPVVVIKQSFTRELVAQKHSVACFGLGFQTAALRGGANFDAVVKKICFRLCIRTLALRCKMRGSM